MPAKSFGIKASIYDDMRKINSLDLTRNEAKVLICYRLAMDENTRQVRGKSQADLHEACGISKQKFSEASGSLQRRGLITVQRFRSGPQTVEISTLEGDLQPTLSRNSRYPQEGDSGTPRKGDSGTPQKGGNDIFTAPVSAPKSAPQCAGAGEVIPFAKPVAGAPAESEADRLHRQAYHAGLANKAGRTAKSARAIQRTVGELDGSSGITFADGKLTVVNGSAAAILEDFPGVDLAAVCDKAGPEVSRMGYPTHGDAMAVLRKWARIETQNGARGKHSKPHPAEIEHRVSPDIIRYARPANEGRF